MSDTLDTMILESFSRLCAAEIDHGAQDRLEQGTFETSLWGQVEQLGLPGLLTDYAGELEDAHRTAQSVAELCGYHSVPLPLIENMIAREALAGAGIEGPGGLLGLGSVKGQLIQDRGETRLSIQGHAVIPWASHAGHLVIAVDSEEGQGIALVERHATGLAIKPSRNLAGEPRDHVELVDTPCVRYVAMPGCLGRIELQSARLRAAAMVGAVEGALDLTTAYVKDRVQFGKPIGRFQAVQQSLATLAGELTSARSACSLAFACESPDWRAVAVAKMRADVAASLACNVAHQAHGAIGVTFEYPLHRRTRRLWSWRSENGSGAHWAQRLGRAFIAQGADRLWASITELRLAEGSAHVPAEQV